MKKISVVVPIYNVSSYLCKCIESLINQKITNYEIILVDDGSTDNSGRICDFYKKQNNKIMVIHKKNGGLSSARNEGVKSASGEYVLFVDGDDYIYENTLLDLSNILDDYSCDIIQFKYLEVKENENISIKNNSKEMTCLNTKEEIYKKLYELGGIGASACTKLIRKELLLKHPFKNTVHEDEQWCTDVYENETLNIIYVSNVYYFYVFRQNSIVHSSFNKRKLDSLLVSYDRLQSLKRLDFSELIPIESNRMYFKILSLYYNASLKKDFDSMNYIRSFFERSKVFLDIYLDIDRKYNLLYKLMKFDFTFVKIYCYKEYIKKYRRNI